MQTHYSMAELNALSAAEFVLVVGPVFENSPWIAEQTAPQRPFAQMNDLRIALWETVLNSSDDKRMGLIKAHPDLVGNAALSGSLTSESAREQAAAGLNQLSPDEIVLFKNQNAAYWQQFGFPFIICARESKKEAIITGFERRLRNSRAEETSAALGEVFKIAHFRLRDLIIE